MFRKSGNRMSWGNLSKNYFISLFLYNFIFVKRCWWSIYIWIDVSHTIILVQTLMIFFCKTFKYFPLDNNWPNSTFVTSWPWYLKCVFWWQNLVTEERYLSYVIYTFLNFLTYNCKIICSCQKFEEWREKFL